MPAGRVRRQSQVAVTRERDVCGTEPDVMYDGHPRPRVLGLGIAELRAGGGPKITRNRVAGAGGARCGRRSFEFEPKFKVQTFRPNGGSVFEKP